MIAGLALAAAALTSAPASLASWSEIARELEATGSVSCSLTNRERRISRATLKRAIRRPGGEVHDARTYPACAVIRIKVSKAGLVTSWNFVRFKGPGGEQGVRSLTGLTKFAPRRRDWESLMYIVVQVEPDRVAQQAADWRALDAKMSGVPQTSLAK